MRWEDLKFFNPRGAIAFSQNRLPHWQQPNGIYFVTFRLGDAVPKQLLERWMTDRAMWMRLHPLPWTDEEENEYHTRFSSAMERWLDAGHGSCVLRRPACAEIVAEALGHFEGARYEQLSWVIMPNHVHALFALRSDSSLETVLHSWKRFTARRINAQLSQTGNLWQRDYFDRLVRDGTHFARCVSYIRRNPAKAKLRMGEYLVWESDLAQQVG